MILKRKDVYKKNEKNFYQKYEKGRAAFFHLPMGFSNRAYLNPKVTKTLESVLKDLEVS